MTWQSWRKVDCDRWAWRILLAGLTLLWAASLLESIRVRGPRWEDGEFAWRALVVLLLVHPGWQRSRLDPPLPAPAPDPASAGAGSTISQDSRPEKGQDLVAASPTKETPPGPGPDPAMPSETGSLDGAWRIAKAKLQEIDQRWGREAPGAARTAVRRAGGQEAMAVAELAVAVAEALQAAGEADLEIRNSRLMAERLRQAAPGGEAAARPPSERLGPLKPFADWRAQGGRGAFEYVKYLVRQEEEASALAAADRDSSAGREIDWRGPAEALLAVAAGHRPAAGELDGHGFRRLHETLQDLLGYEEIEVAVGDAVDRDIHEIDSLRGSRKQPPNRVLEILAPGYRERASGKVRRKAVVVLSEPVLE